MRAMYSTAEQQVLNLLVLLVQAAGSQLTCFTSTRVQISLALIRYARAVLDSGAAQKKKMLY